MRCPIARREGPPVGAAQFVLALAVPAPVVVLPVPFASTAAAAATAAARRADAAAAAYAVVLFPIAHTAPPRAFRLWPLRNRFEIIRHR